MSHYITRRLAAAAGAVLCLSSGAWAQATASGDGLSAFKQMVQSYAPELRERVQKLSPETRATVVGLHAKHPRRSDRLTLRQVMHEILSDYQSVAAAIATDNAEQAADSARRLANHRIPKGGLFPYFALAQVNDEAMSVLPGMNDAVEGGALRLAEAAEKGDMAAAAVHLGEVMAGCVACHQYFRGIPGESPRLLPPKAN